MFSYDNFMIVLSSPSGAGKTTLSRMLMEEDDKIKLSISCTTRPPRPSEVDGRDYHFVSKAQYDKMVKNGEFLEYAENFGHHYGTPKDEVERLLGNGYDVLFDIDWQGARQMTEKVPAEKLLKIFILPPSLQELQRRLYRRSEDAEEVIQQRMAEAQMDISHYNEYDYVIINNNVHKALEKIKAIIKAKRIKVCNKEELKGFVKRISK